MPHFATPPAPRNPRRPRSGPALLLTLLLAACAGQPSPLPEEPPPLPGYDLAGPWNATFTVDGEPLAGMLDVTQDDGTLTLVFDSEIGISRGTGSLDDDRVTGRIDYEIQCPGVATLDGEVATDGQTVSGTFTAVDCTGAVDGTFTWTRP